MVKLWKWGELKNRILERKIIENLSQLKKIQHMHNWNPWRKKKDIMFWGEKRVVCGKYKVANVAKLQKKLNKMIIIKTCPSKIFWHQRWRSNSLGSIYLWVEKIIKLSSVFSIAVLNSKRHWSTTYKKKKSKKMERKSKSQILLSS